MVTGQILSPEDHASLYGLPWVALQTNAGQEFNFECDLVRSGFTVYVPRHVERRHKAKPGWRNNTIEVARALFPSYAFLLGNAAAAQRFVSSDFNTTQRHVKRLPSLLSQGVMDSIQQAEQRAQGEQWGKWSPETSTVLYGLHAAITGVLPKRFRRLSDLQRMSA